ncbi:MAG: hypothetical protein ACFFB5_04930 [Promethearchaeota archaeon]
MSVFEEFQQRNQRIIHEILVKENKSLSLFELKKKSQLANLYFFKALDQLEQKDVLERKRKYNNIWISLKDVDDNASI